MNCSACGKPAIGRTILLLEDDPNTGEPWTKDLPGATIIEDEGGELHAINAMHPTEWEQVFNQLFMQENTCMFTLFVTNEPDRLKDILMGEEKDGDDTED